jgi:hypothetical protein
MDLREMELDVVRTVGFPVPPDPLATDERIRAYGSATGVCAWLYAFGIKAGYAITDVIDLIVSDPGYAEATHRLTDATKRTRSTRSAAPTNAVHDRIAQLMLPAEAKPLADEATRLLQAIFDSINQPAPANRAPLPAAVAVEEMQRQNLLWFMSDPMIPSEIAEGRIGALRVGVELMLLDLRAWLISFPNAAPDVTFTLNDEDLLTIVALLNEDLSALLKLVASLPHANVAESLVPTCDRLDFAALVERQNKVMTALAEICTDVR